MKKTLLKIVYFIFFVIIHLVLLFQFIYVILVKFILYTFYYPCYDHYQQMIVKFPQSYRERIKVFDSNGLRHNAEWLKDNVAKVALMPIELQKEYADAQTVEKGPKLYIDYENLPTITELNATAIGNMAYLVLSHDTKWEDRAELESYLEQVREYYQHHQKN